MTPDDDFLEATRSYERWRASRIPVVSDDLALKHERLATSPFVLLRGTYHRFLQRLRTLLPELADAPVTIVVGDLHVENFGRCRDRDGRIAWGVNDLDEIDVLPYTIDLVWLATSALLAVRASHFTLDQHDVCEAIASGWRERVEQHSSEPFDPSRGIDRRTRHAHPDHPPCPLPVPPGRRRARPRRAPDERLTLDGKLHFPGRLPDVRRMVHRCGRSIGVVPQSSLGITTEHGRERPTACANV
jgi:hypothetical protein